jgi:hypothetical protein
MAQPAFAAGSAASGFAAIGGVVANPEVSGLSAAIAKPIAQRRQAQFLFEDLCHVFP